MPACDFLKCCTNFFCCKYNDDPKSVGLRIRAKVRRKGIQINNTLVNTGDKKQRRSVYNQRKDTDDIESKRTLVRQKIKLKYEPDNGIVWNAFHWFGRWLFSASVASLLIWCLSLVFLRIHLDNYENNCDLETRFVIDGGEIKQVWSNPIENKNFTDRCSLENNPIVGNVTNILIFLLTLALGAGLDKYKETLRLYEEVAGDIKAMAMLLVHLTFDGEKYELEEGKLSFKKDVEFTYRKMKYLLSSLAPTVKNTIAGGEYTVQYRPGKCSCPKTECSSRLFLWSSPFEALSDRKYFEVKEQPNYTRWFFSSNVEYPNYWKDAEDQINDPQKYKDLRERIRVKLDPNIDTESMMRDFRIYEGKEFKFGKQKNDRMRLAELIEQAGQDLNAEVQHALYKKITDINKWTEMDAFECSMTVLMDEIMRLFENGLGFGEDEGSAIASAAIERWNAIYGTWGTLSSLKTFSEPLIVNIFRAVLIGIYAWFMPKTYLKYNGVLDDYWLFIFVGGDMLVFCWMWWLAFAVRNPFKNSFIIRNVSKLAYQTQFQVQQLMANQIEFDKRDYNSDSKYGYIGDRGGGQSKTIGVDIFKPTDEESVEDILARSLNNRNRIAVSNQRELNKIIADALKGQENILKEFLNRLPLKKTEERAGEQAGTKDEDGDVPKGLRRRGLNF
jgi:hypothetical protein